MPRNPAIPMKTPRLLLSVAAFATAALAGFAAFESARALPDNPMPVYPNALKLGGVTQGRAVIAISVDRDGRVKDQLVLAYTDPQFARTSTEVLHDWRFAPARFDGEPVVVLPREQALPPGHPSSVGGWAHPRMGPGEDPTSFPGRTPCRCPQVAENTAA